MTNGQPGAYRTGCIGVSRAQDASAQVRGSFAGDCGHEQETLAGRAADLVQERELFVRLNALRDHGQAQRLAHRDDGADQFVGAVASRQAADERTVDLERVHREPVQRLEGGVPGPEVVDVEPEPGVVHLVHKAQGRLGGAHDHALGDLKGQSVRREVVAPQGLKHLGQQVLVPELLVRDVHAHVGDAGSPSGELSADLVDDPVAEPDDHPCLGHDRQELLRQEQAALGVVPAH